MRKDARMKRWAVVLAVVASLAAVATVTVGGMVLTRSQHIATTAEELAFESAVCQSVQYHLPPPAPIRIGPNTWEIDTRDTVREGVPPGAETLFVACSVDVSGA
jgi:hypothetical protein